MEGLSSTPNGVTSEYLPMGNCESDDSQSNASKSDDNDVIPGIIYTSDDSADIGQSDSTFVDSDAPNYIAQSVNQGMEDELSGEFLLASNSPQPLTQVNDPFLSHSLAAMNINCSVHNVIDGRSLAQNKTHLYVDHPKVNLQVNPVEGIGLSRSTSISSSSTEPEFTPEAPFLSEYEPLSSYPDDEAYSCGLNFEAMKDDPIKTQVIQEQLNRLQSSKELNKMRRPDRFYVGNVHIDPAYMDAFYVKWNWPKIRQTCVFINISLLIGFLCVGIGLLIQMPEGSECDPVLEWWQGTTSYYIFVPSFQDTDGNGVGDIKGIISRLDYIEQLGIKTVRLSTIFESEDFLKASIIPSNYSNVAKVLGDSDDLQLLAALLHERNMYLTIDMPLAIKKEMKSTLVYTPSIDLVRDVSLVIHKWTELGVDGFIFTDIDHLSHVENLIHALQSWRTVLDRKSRKLHRRVMMVPINLLKRFEAENSPDLAFILSLVNLIDVHLHMNQTGIKMAELIEQASSWDTRASLPWVNWNLGGVGYKRLSSHLSSESNTILTDPTDLHRNFSLPTLGSTIFQLFLPGSVTLYYGDEISNPDVQDTIHKEVTWASPMCWSPTLTNGGFSEGNPWLPLRKDWQMWNMASLNYSLEPLRVMIKASQEKVPLYINGIFQNVGDYHPTKATNYKIRLATDNLLILDRFYPRRNKYMIVFNLGTEPIEKNLSKLYFGGYVLASSHGKSGYIRFHHIILEPGEALACILDK